jgi:urea transport system substrate-binding protein
MNIKNKKFLVKYITWILMLFSITAVAAYYYYNHWSKRPIKVGLMASLHGNMAVREKDLVQATQLAIAEINEKGGLLGRKVELIIKDGRSDPKVFVQIAKELIEEDKVDVVFGCWTSSCRKSVLPIFEKNNHLLYYPSQYEGLESSKTIIYLGSIPNQQVTPALEWVFSKRGKKIYLIGSDYVYPRATNEIIKDQTTQFRGQIVGEYYAPLGGTEFSTVVEDIKKIKPDAVFNTINGISNLHFFKAMRQSGIYPKDIPIFSFSISEREISTFSDVEMTGDFVLLSYLQNLKTAQNRDFIQRLQIKFGQDSIAGDTFEAIYLGVHLWAKAVIAAGSSQADLVRNFASGKSIQGAGGMLYIDEKTRHGWKYIHIAKINQDNLLESVWSSKVPIAPEPFPASRSPQQWQHYLNELYKGWGGRWQAPTDE